MLGESLKRMCIQLIKSEPLALEKVEEFALFIKGVMQEFIQFKQEESNCILFGRKTEMDDIRNAQMQMRIVPTSNKEF